MPNSEQGSAIKTRKASCRCGKLSVTYAGPDPERITVCHCNSCQLRTGTVFSVQARFPRAMAKIEGKSTKWAVPRDTEAQACDSGGATYHFCPACGSTVYWDISTAPDVIGVAIGTLTDAKFPPPKISGFESYGHPWAMKPADLPIQRLKLAE
ncbi:MAG: GFA family protein [Actinomycetia bacterium]|nr:GFA family protein [Actinomycetes bacterium]